MSRDALRLRSIDKALGSTINCASSTVSSSLGDRLTTASGEIIRFLWLNWMSRLLALIRLESGVSSNESPL
jgi:hypothetical protein